MPARLRHAKFDKFVISSSSANQSHHHPTYQYLHSHRSFPLFAKISLVTLADELLNFEWHNLLRSSPVRQHQLVLDKLCDLPPDHVLKLGRAKLSVFVAQPPVECKAREVRVGDMDPGLKVLSG